MGAQTTTAVNGCDTSIWLDSAAGALTDISGSTNKIDMEFDHELGEYRAFGTKWRGRLECGKDAKFTLYAIYTTTATETVRMIHNWFFAAAPGARSFKVYVPNKNVGSDVFTCEVRLDNYKFTPDVNDPNAIMATIVLLPDGAVTYSTAAT